MMRNETTWFIAGAVWWIVFHSAPLPIQWLYILICLGVIIMMKLRIIERTKALIRREQQRLAADHQARFGDEVTPSDRRREEAEADQRVKAAIRKYRESK